MFEVSSPISQDIPKTFSLVYFLFGTITGIPTATVIIQNSYKKDWNWKQPQMNIQKNISAIVKTIVFYAVLAAIGTLFVSVGTSVVKSSQLIKSIKKSDSFLMQDSPEKALTVIKDAQHLAPSYPSYFRALHCNAVKAYARLSEFTEAQDAAQEVYGWNSSKYMPSSTLLAPLASRGDMIVNIYLQIYGTGSSYNKWAGYNTLLKELRRTDNFEMLEEVADRMLAVAPNSRLARRTKAYVKSRETIAATRENKMRTARKKTDSRTRHKTKQNTTSTSANKTETSSKSKESGIRTDNPYAKQYVKAKEQYVKFYKTVEKLKDKRDSATGQKRMEYANQLHKMKHRGVSLQREYQQAARLYKQWNQQNPSD